MNWVWRMFRRAALNAVPEFETDAERRMRTRELERAERQTLENLARLRRMGYEVDVTLRRIGKQNNHAAH
jgi:hypothetical protein